MVRCYRLNGRAAGIVFPRSDLDADAFCGVGNELRSCSTIIRTSTREDIKAALECAAAVVNEREGPAAKPA